MVYGDGKRAIIAVAKDATGVRAFAQALAGWDGSAAAAAPPITRFTEAFAVWNDYETAAVSGANGAAPRTTGSGSLVEQPSSNTVVDATPANNASGNLKLAVALLVGIVVICFCVLWTIVASPAESQQFGGILASPAPRLPRATKTNQPLKRPQSRISGLDLADDEGVDFRAMKQHATKLSRPLANSPGTPER